MNREEYIRWICEITRRTSNKELSENSYHYKVKDDVKICETYHRNAVSNWRLGRNLPKNLETFISIALFDFDTTHALAENADMDIIYRNERCNYVQAKMIAILGKDLYCRNIYELLLIQVCRGIISFKDVLRLQVELEKKIADSVGGTIQRQDYALVRKTTNINGNLYKTTTWKETLELVEDFKRFFCLGNYILGERFQQCFETKTRKRYEKPLSLSEAVRLYAPNYKVTINRIFSTSGISREWLIDLCIHLRFNREELQEILQYAHLVPLSEYSDEQEYYYREKEQMPIGSAKWYQNLESQEEISWKGHFYGFEEMNLWQKMMISVLICSYVKYEKKLLPIDYMLESFLFYEQGKELLKEFEKFLEKFSQDEIWSKKADALLFNKDFFINWSSYIETIETVLLKENENVKEMYQNYRNECKEYFSYKKRITESLSESVNAKRLKYIAGMVYTVFTGKYYQGRISQEDLDHIRRQFEGKISNVNGNHSNDTTGQKGQLIYKFINHFFIVFLSRQPLQEDENGKYYVMNGSKRTKAFQLEDVYEYFWQSLQMLKAEKQNKEEL